MLSQVAEDAAVHAHPDGAVTEISSPAAPPAATEKLAGARAIAHAGGGEDGGGGGGEGDGCGAGVGAGDGCGSVPGGGSGAGTAAPPACVSATRTSFSRISACLAELPEFATTRNSTRPLPCPAAGARSVIQLACATAVQAHSGNAVTVSVTTPPVAPTGTLAGAIVTAHLTTDGSKSVVETDEQLAAPRAATGAIQRQTGPIKGARRDGRVPPRPAAEFHMREVRLKADTTYARRLGERADMTRPAEREAGET
jgi:hypothetical protein